MRKLLGQKALGFLLLPLLAGCGEQPSEQELTRHAETAVALFFQSCVHHFGVAAEVSTWARQNGFVPLDKAAQEKLPFGMIELDAQHVWQADKNGGVFYLSTMPENGCSIKVLQADESTVRQRFAEWAEQGAAGLTVAKRADHYSASPFPFSRLVYAWYGQDRRNEILLAANTSPDTRIPAQASLSFNREPISNATVVAP